MRTSDFSRRSVLAASLGCEPLSIIDAGECRPSVRARNVFLGQRNNSANSCDRARVAAENLLPRCVAESIPKGKSTDSRRIRDAIAIFARRLKGRTFVLNGQYEMHRSASNEQDGKALVGQVLTLLQLPQEFSLLPCD